MTPYYRKSLEKHNVIWNLCLKNIEYNDCCSQRRVFNVKCFVLSDGMSKDDEDQRNHNNKNICNHPRNKAVSTVGAVQVGDKNHSNPVLEQYILNRSKKK